MQGNAGLVLLYDLVFWAQVQPYSSRHRLVPPGAGAPAQLALAEPALELAVKRLSPMVFALFQEPPKVPSKFFPPLVVGYVVPLL